MVQFNKIAPLFAGATSDEEVFYFKSLCDVAKKQDAKVKLVKPKDGIEIPIILDAEDYKTIKSFKIHTKKRRNLQRDINIVIDGREFLLSRYLMGLGTGDERIVDHIDSHTSNLTFKS